MFSRMLQILAVSVIVISCTKGTSTRVPCVILATQPIHDGSPEGTIVDNVTKGSTLYYLGERSPDSSSLKVEFNGKVGWIAKGSVIIDSSPAVITGPGLYFFNPENANPAASLPRGTVVATDSVIGSRSHVYFSLRYPEISDAWVSTTDLNSDAEQIAFAIELEEISHYSTADLSRAYNHLFQKYSGSPLISEVSIDLSELNDFGANELQNNYPVVVDKPNGKILALRSSVDEQVAEYARDVLGGSVPYSFAGIKPRSIFYQRYMTQLPAYVKLPSVSDYAQYFEKLGTKQSVAAYLLYRADRSPENVRKLYEAYGPLIREVAQLYPIRAQVKTLVNTFTHIKEIPDYKKVCADISAEVTQWDRDHQVEGGFTEGGFILEAQKSIYEPIMHPSVTESWDVTSAVWYHSFWVRRLAEGNADVVFNILQDLAVLDYPGGQETDEVVYDAPDDAPDDEGFGDSPFEVTTVVCTYQEYSEGDCGHIIFDCGDYGDADTGALAGSEAESWKSLFDVEDGKYLMAGRKFEITSRMGPGDVCGPDGNSPGQVPIIISFKLLP